LSNQVVLGTGLLSMIRMDEIWFPDFCAATPPVKVSLSEGESM
jgi:hypothetical protein